MSKGNLCGTRQPADMGISRCTTDGALGGLGVALACASMIPGGPVPDCGYAKQAKRSRCHMGVSTKAGLPAQRWEDFGIANCLKQPQATVYLVNS